MEVVYFSYLHMYYTILCAWYGGAYVAQDAHQHGTWHGLNGDGAFWVMETALILVSSPSNQAIVTHQGTITLYMVVYIITMKEQNT